MKAERARTESGFQPLVPDWSVAGVTVRGGAVLYLPNGMSPLPSFLSVRSVFDFRHLGPTGDTSGVLIMLSFMILGGSPQEKKKKSCAQS